MTAQLRIIKPLEARVLEAFQRKGAWIELTRDDLFHRMGAADHAERAKAVRVLHDLANRGLVRSQSVNDIAVWSATAAAREGAK